MHILILELDLTGHHATYLFHVAKAFLRDGASVSVVVCESSAQHPVIQELSRIGQGKFAVHGREFRRGRKTIFGAQATNEVKARDFFKEAFKFVNRLNAVDRVFLPYLDYCLYAFSIFGAPFSGAKWGGICMRPAFHYPLFGVEAPVRRIDFAKAWLFKRLLLRKGLYQLFTIDLLLQQYAQKKIISLADRISYLEDPAELSNIYTPAESKRLLGLASDSRVILVYGAIDRRKGIEGLIKALYQKKYDSLGSIHVLVVGKQSQWVQELLLGNEAQTLIREGRIHQKLGYASDELQAQVFAACDLVWLGYINHYTMSGVLVMAANSGKKVLATTQGLIGWYGKRMKYAQTFDPNNVDQISIAIDKSLADEMPSGISAIGHEFANHNWSYFENKLRINFAEVAREN